MKLPVWVQPAILGALLGGIVVAVVGFNWGGWTLRHTAVEMADTMARDQLVAALLPICLEQAKADPNAADALAAMREARSYERDALLVSTGWATMPGTTGANRFVVTACVEKLVSTS